MIVKLDAEDLRGLVESVVKETKKHTRLTVEGLRRIIREEAEAMMAGDEDTDDKGAREKIANEIMEWMDDHPSAMKEFMGFRRESDDLAEFANDLLATHGASDISDALDLLENSPSKEVKAVVGYFREGLSNY